ncbi:hypothetical protein C8Q75DRAFT_732356 [Abortiporus biennis]|nr:hypothetical protein C8Q75DRAFT_732356 [Abortiporus biennis]
MIIDVRTALNVLRNQNVEALAKTGIHGIAINGATATHQNFKDIEDRKYHVIVVSPEQVMKPSGGFEKLFSKEDFSSRLITMVFDKAHYIMQWNDFRPEYKKLECLRYLLPNIPFIVALITLPEALLISLKQLLRLQQDKLLVKYADLGFLVKEGWKLGDEVPLNIPNSINAGRFLHHRLSSKFYHKIVWFHSEMSSSFKEMVVEKLKNREIWGIYATDSFKMRLGHEA